MRPSGPARGRQQRPDRRSGEQPRRRGSRTRGPGALFFTVSSTTTGARRHEPWRAAAAASSPSRWGAQRRRHRGHDVAVVSDGGHFVQRDGPCPVGDVGWTSSTRRVLPTPPGPTSVISRSVAMRRCSSASSCSRPTSGEAGRGRRPGPVPPAGAPRGRSWRPADRARPALGLGELGTGVEAGLVGQPDNRRSRAERRADHVAPARRPSGGRARRRRCVRSRSGSWPTARVASATRRASCAPAAAAARRAASHCSVRSRRSSARAVASAASGATSANSANAAPRHRARAAPSRRGIAPGGAAGGTPGLGRVELVGLEGQAVPRAGPGEPLGGGPEVPAQARHVAVQGPAARVGHLVGPDGVEQLVGGHDATLGHGQQGEHCPAPGPRDVDGPACDGQLQRPQQVDPHLHVTLRLAHLPVLPVVSTCGRRRTCGAGPCSATAVQHPCKRVPGPSSHPHRGGPLRERTGHDHHHPRAGAARRRDARTIRRAGPGVRPREPLLHRGPGRPAGVRLPAGGRAARARRVGPASERGDAPPAAARLPRPRDRHRRQHAPLLDRPGRRSRPLRRRPVRLHPARGRRRARVRRGPR